MAKKWRVELPMKNFTEHAGGVNFVDSVGHVEEDPFIFPRIRARLEACFPGIVFTPEPDMKPPPIPAASAASGSSPAGNPEAEAEPEPAEPEPADESTVDVVKEGGKVKAVKPKGKRK